MILDALLLFGSRARGDHSDSSDIDLLAITENEKPTVSGSADASLFHYSFDWLQNKASSGDLFVWHLVTEAIAIYDPAENLKALRQGFRFKGDYRKQITQASDVGWLISLLGDEMSAEEANRWLAWAVRTISIAHAATLQKPAFSGSALAKVLGYPDIEVLVRQKDKKSFDDAARGLLKKFLGALGSGEAFHPPHSIDRFRSHFEASANEVGLTILNGQVLGSLYHN